MRWYIIILILFLTSCSIQKQLSKSARENVLSSKTLATAHVGISIYEPSTGKYWYEYQGDKYFVPASNTKIPTCYAAMKYLGDSLVGAKYLLRNDSLALIGVGDPTFLHPDYKRHPVFDFIKNTRFKKFVLGESLPKNIDALGSGWSWNDYNENYMAERNFFPMYGNVVRFSIKDGIVVATPPGLQEKTRQLESFSSFEVERMQDLNEFIVGKGSNKYQEVPFKTSLAAGSITKDLLSDTIGVEVGQVFITANYPGLKDVYSQPTDSMLKPMMHRSDNFFAEQSLLMVSHKLLGRIDEPRWADGSGLSRYNLFTPEDMVAILNKMKNEFGMERIKIIFPTGGEGTISSYYKTEAGNIYAKTGTLSGVVALSGFLTTKKNKELIFSVLVNNHQASATDVRRAVEKFLQGVRNRY
jgi:D-alanyl-D-alanine carboxypeptidase/D-alanyl-D-alanine-endopeptidase (penicillin-binding protein 4)